MDNYERITYDKEFDGPIRESHEYRYKVASRFTKDDDVVVDAACGIGYGKKFLKGKYNGVDKIEGHIQADLQTWIPDFEYDVFVTIETIEHLLDYSQHIKNAKNAKRIIVASTPIIPTVAHLPDGSIDISQFHVNDFTLEQLKGLFEDKNWRLIHEETQFNLYGIVVFERHDD